MPDYFDDVERDLWQEIASTVPVGVLTSAGRYVVGLTARLLRELPIAVYPTRTHDVLTLSRAFRIASALTLQLMAKAREPIRTQKRPAAARKGMVVGYKRVSALDQADLRQLDGMETDKLFTDKASGKDTNRPQLTAMLGFVREGDTIVCHAMDRLPGTSMNCASSFSIW